MASGGSSLKNYLLTLITLCSEEQFGQDAVEWAILSGWIKLTYHRDTDLRTIMDQYDQICEAYQRVCRLHDEVDQALPLAA